MTGWRWRASKQTYIRGILVISVFLSLAAFGLVRVSKKAPPAPTFKVERGEFLDVLQFRGELKAQRCVTISAPADAGDLQIVKIAQDGAQVKKGDVVVEFDPSRTKQELAQSQSTLKSAQAEITQAREQGKLAEEEDTTAVVKARYAIEVAKLDASKNEIVSHIEGAEAGLKVSDAQQSLREAEQKLESDQTKNSAAVDSKGHAAAKAQFDVSRSERILSSMQLRAPSDGSVSLVPVWHDGNEHPFKAGESAWSGAPLAELPDPSTLRVVAHVDETERGRLVLAQKATIQLDAIADRQFTGTIGKIGTIASTDFTAGWPFPRNFNLDIVLDGSDSRLRPGMTVQITVILQRVPNVISIPLQSSFLKSGRTVAYVWNGSKFEEREISVSRRSRDRALIASGLAPGDVVALTDSSAKE